MEKRVSHLVTAQGQDLGAVLDAGHRGKLLRYQRRVLRTGLAVETQEAA